MSRSEDAACKNSTTLTFYNHGVALFLDCGYTMTLCKVVGCVSVLLHALSYSLCSLIVSGVQLHAAIA